MADFGEENTTDLASSAFMPLKRMKTTFGLPMKRRKASKPQFGEIKELDRDDDHDSSSAFSRGGPNVIENEGRNKNVTNHT